MPPEAFRWMTRDEWDGSTDLWLMLHNSEQKTGNQRRMSLFGAACCRRYWSHLLSESREILTEFEALLDHLVNPTAGDVFEAGQALCHRANAVVGQKEPLGSMPDALRLAAAKAVCYAVIGSPWGAYGYFTELDSTARVSFVDLLRDIFGNPFRPVAFLPEWHTDTAALMARQMYESRDFGAMPILADAIQEAGCDNRDILDHCRGPGPHVRGCWSWT